MSGRLWILTLVALAAASVAPAQDPRLDYQMGVEALQRGDARTAVDLLSRAIASHPREEKTFLISGNHYVIYVPHLYLGLALERTGEIARARSELQESKRQRVVASAPALLRQLDEALERIGKALERPPIPTKNLATPIPPEATPIHVEATVPPTTPPLPAVLRLGSDRPPRTALPSPASSAGLTAADRERLREGLRDFFSSRYESALQELAPLAESGSDVASLFAAYSLCAIYLASGGQDEKLIVRARNLYRKTPRKLLLYPKPGVSPRLIMELERSASR